MKKLPSIASTMVARLLSAVNHKIAIVGLLAASIVAASAANVNFGTVGTMNGNSRTFTAATGGSNSFAVFTNDLAAAFATNNAGVLNFDGTNMANVNVGDTITLSYGASVNSNLVLTLTSGNSINQANVSGEATSGASLLGLGGDGSTRVFTPSQPLRAVAIFNSNRGDAGRTCALNVTFMDNTTASTSGANGGAWYFHELEAAGTNYIKSFSISQNNFIRYDDLAFIVAPPVALPPPPWSVATNSTTTNSVAVNFVNASGLGIDNSQPGSLLTSETAGAPGYAQTRWNNLAKQGTGFDGSVSLTNSLGVMTRLFINWDAGFTGSSGATNLGTPDGKLMDGFLGGNQTIDTVSTNVYSSDSHAKPLVYVSGLQAWCQAQGAEGFGVVIYRNDDPYYDTSVAWVQSVTGSPTNNTMAGGPDLTPRLYNTHSAVFNGTNVPYTQVPSTATNQANKSYGANYCVFNALTNDAVLIRTGDTNESWGGGPMNGFQIVPVFPTRPTAGTPTISPSSTVFAGVPVTLTEVATGDPIQPQLWYQWQSDNGSGGAVTNNLLNATNATYAFTPNNSASTLRFQVTVTNAFGASTSSVVTLTVSNRAPVAGSSFTMGATIGTPTTVKIIGGKSSPTDADNDALILSGVTGAANGTVSTDGTNVTYTATSGTTDSFTYTVNDGHGGTASRTINVTISAASAGFNQMSAQVVSGNAQLTYLGIPGSNYALDWTHSLTPPVTWLPLVTNTAAGNGYLLFTNTPSGGSDFYRTRYVP